MMFFRENRVMADRFSRYLRHADLAGGSPGRLTVLRPRRLPEDRP